MGKVSRKYWWYQALNREGDVLLKFQAKDKDGLAELLGYKVTTIPQSDGNGMEWETEIGVPSLLRRLFGNLLKYDHGAFLTKDIFVCSNFVEWEECIMNPELKEYKRKHAKIDTMDAWNKAHVWREGQGTLVRDTFSGGWFERYQQRVDCTPITSPSDYTLFHEMFTTSEYLMEGVVDNYAYSQCEEVKEFIVRLEALLEMQRESEVVETLAQAFAM
jgi:hypothetical protein